MSEEERCGLNRVARFMKLASIVGVLASKQRRKRQLSLP